MSLPAQPKVLLRHSLYIWVLLAMVGILSLSFVAFRAISEQMQTQKIDPVYDRFDELQLESARNLLKGWGRDGAGALHEEARRHLWRIALLAGCDGQGSRFWRGPIANVAYSASDQVAHGDS